MRKEKEQNFLNDGEIDLRVIFGILKRERSLVFGLIFLSTIITTIYCYKVKPIWSGSFNIVVKNDKQSDNTSSLQFGSLFKNFNKNDDNATEKLILESPFILNPVFNYVKQYQKSNGLNIKNLTFNKWVKSDLKIDFEDDTSILNVEYINKDKKLILKVLDMIAKKYKDYSKRDAEKRIIKTINYLEMQTELMKAKSLSSQKAFNEFSIQNGLGNIDGFVSLGDSSRSNLINPNSGNNLMSNNQYFLENLNYSNPSQDSSAGQRFSNQFARLESYEDSYVDLSSKLKPNTKTLIVLKDKIDNLRTALKRPNKILLEFRKLQSEALRNEKILLTLEESLQLNRLNKINTPDPWEIISVPTLKSDPVFPSKKIFVSISLFISFIVGSALAIIKEKSSGLIFELNDFKLSIPFKFFECLYKNDIELNTIILEDKLGKISNKKIGLIYLTESFLISKNLNKNIIFKDSENLKFYNLSQITQIEKCEEVILLSESGKIKSINLDRVIKYLSPYKEKVRGWFFIK